jgi:predicted transcriptional regulator
MINNDVIEHYGVKRRSGRYPWGSGEDPFQHESFTFLNKVDEYRSKGMSEKEIAKEFGMSLTKFRNEITLANGRIRQSKIDQARAMKEDGATNQEIADRLGIAESSVRNYLNPKSGVREQQMQGLISELKDQVDKHPYLDVGHGVEYELSIEKQMNISRGKLDSAIQQLEKEGYHLYTINVKDPRDFDKATKIKVLTKEDDISEVYKNYQDIRSPRAWTDDGGKTWQNIEPPKNIDWDKVEIRYAEDGGKEKDGTIELRRGVSDLDMGDSHYAQVRIAVGGTHYLKGMAFYSDDIPAGKNIIFNTNKPQGTPKEKVLKELKDNPDNPFGATITRQNGALNIVYEEGSWDSWNNTLSSQFLSKQPISLVKDRLDATYKSTAEELDALKQIQQPVIKQHLLDRYAEQCDKQTVHLKAQGVSKQSAAVILPVVSMKPTEIYAPNLKNGTRVVLLRHPHAGRFESPELVVNNKQPEARKTLGNAIDAVGIHPSVASKLSGADFDGDTVYVIPNNKGMIKTAPTLPELKNFDPNVYEVGHKTMDKTVKQYQMGTVSNLITDMTIKGAPMSDIVRAVRHSMVVIDAPKHNLDWKQSAVDNGIAALHKKWQGNSQGRASTLISQQKKEVVIRKPKHGEVPDESYILDKKTRVAIDKNGVKFNQTYYVDKDGKEYSSKEVETRFKMTLLDDANKMSSGSPVEKQYANYINKVKGLKQQALKESAKIDIPKQDKAAAKKYFKEVKSLEQKLIRAEANAPRERQARIQTSYYYWKKYQRGMDKDDRKKLVTQITAAARAKVGASSKSVRIKVTPNEWEAIMHNALPKSKLTKMLNYIDTDDLFNYVMPKQTVGLAPSKISRARAMYESGKTWQEIADAIGVSTSTIREYVLE